MAVNLEHCVHRRPTRRRESDMKRHDPRACFRRFTDAVCQPGRREVSTARAPTCEASDDPDAVRELRPVRVPVDECAPSRRILCTGLELPRPGQFNPVPARVQPKVRATGQCGALENLHQVKTHVETEGLTLLGCAWRDQCEYREANSENNQTRPPSHRCSPRPTNPEPHSHAD